MKKNILVVDDSALMRRMLCDIINSDDRFHVKDKATNGEDALELLRMYEYDAVVLDVIMPRMNGIELLRALQKYQVKARVMMASTDTMDGGKTTMEALELGALDFIHKPNNAVDCKKGTFRDEFLKTLEAVTGSRPSFTKPVRQEVKEEAATAKITHKVADIARQHKTEIKAPGKRIVAIASSTGGPKALHPVITNLPKDLSCPVVLVQHMPQGFTKSLAERLNSLSEIEVKEAREGERLKAGCVYIAKGGKHMNVDMKNGSYVIRYSDEPTREGVKPCANYMYESLIGSAYDEIICVVLTGMGADGTVGIANLKKQKKVHVIVQEASTCAVYGMPKSVVQAGLADQIVPLPQIAQEIIMNVGVK